METQTKKRIRFSKLFSRKKKPFYLNHVVETDQAVTGLVSSATTTSFQFDAFFSDPSIERDESKAEPNLILASIQTTDNPFCHKYPISSEKGQRGDSIISPDEALRDIQSFERTSFSMDSVDSEESAINKVLFTEEDNSLPCTPKKSVDLTSHEDIVNESTPRTSNFSCVSVNDTDHKDEDVLPVVTKAASTALRFDDLVGAAVDVLNISKDAINIFKKEPPTDACDLSKSLPQNNEDTSKVIFVNGGVVTKKPLKSSCSTYSEAVTDVEMLLRTPIRNERRTTVIVGKTQSIVSSTMTPKRKNYENESEMNVSQVEDIFDDLDDSPDRAIRFSNCNFHVIKKRTIESFDFDNVYNPFETSDMEAQCIVGKENKNAENIEHINFDGHEDLMDSFDFENAEAFGESSPSNFCDVDPANSFDDVKWESNIQTEVFATSENEFFKDMQSRRDENVNSVLQAMQNISIKRDGATKKRQGVSYSPKSALQIMADKCKDQLDARVRKMAGANVSPEGKSFNDDCERSHLVRETLTPPAPKRHDLRIPTTMDDRKTRSSPNNVLCFPVSNEKKTDNLIKQKMPKSMNTTNAATGAFLVDEVKSLDVKDDQTKIISVRERIAMFNSQKW